MGQPERGPLVGVDYHYQRHQPRRPSRRHLRVLAAVSVVVTALVVWATDGDADIPTATELTDITPVEQAADALAHESDPVVEQAMTEPAAPLSTPPSPDTSEAIPDFLPEPTPDTPARMPKGLTLKSSAVLVVDQETGQVLAARHADEQKPIASLTKLMTALVLLEADLPMDERITITRDDYDRIKYSYSRLVAGDRFTRKELLLLALMSSENRAAAALGRTYPGGMPAFVATMNVKAAELGMLNTRYDDPTGLSEGNVSTAADLVKLIQAAYRQPEIRRYSTHHEETVTPTRRRSLHYVNSNRLIRQKSWRIGLQKTGYTNEAGRCLVMQSKIDGRDVIMVLLDSHGTLTRFADAQRFRRWMERTHPVTRSTARATTTAASS